MCQEVQGKVHTPLPQSDTCQQETVLYSVSPGPCLWFSCTKSNILKNPHEDLVYDGAQTNASRLDCPTPPLISYQDNGPKNSSDYDAKPHVWFL